MATDSKHFCEYVPNPSIFFVGRTAFTATLHKDHCAFRAAYYARLAKYFVHCVGGIEHK